MDVATFYLLFSSRRRHTRCALVTGVQTCALPIFGGPVCRRGRIDERLQVGAAPGDQDPEPQPASHPVAQRSSPSMATTGAAPASPAAIRPAVRKRVL